MKDWKITATYYGTDKRFYVTPASGGKYSVYSTRVTAYSDNIQDAIKKCEELILEIQNH